MKCIYINFTLLPSSSHDIRHEYIAIGCTGVCSSSYSQLNAKHQIQLNALQLCIFVCVSNHHLTHNCNSELHHYKCLLGNHILCIHLQVESKFSKHDVHAFCLSAGLSDLNSIYHACFVCIALVATLKYYCNILDVAIHSYIVIINLYIAMCVCTYVCMQLQSQ